MPAAAGVGALALDASVVLTRLLDDAGGSYAASVLDLARDGDLELWAPALWSFDVANALLEAVRRGRLTRADADAAAGLVASLDARLAPFSTGECLADVRATAASHGLTVTTRPTFMHMARRLDAPLATLDEALARAVRRDPRLFGVGPTAAEGPGAQPPV
jgi:predicted nucleic acid-binding protein